MNEQLASLKKKVKEHNSLFDLDSKVKLLEWLLTKKEETLRQVQVSLAKVEKYIMYTKEYFLLQQRW